MNREQLEARALSRIEKFRLNDGAEVFIQPLGALEKAKAFDQYNILKGSNGNQPTLYEITKAHCFIISRGVVDENGQPLYGEDDDTIISRDFWDSADVLATKIVELTRTAKDDAEKNLQPTLKGNSSSA